MKLLQNYILYSTIFALFTEALNFHFFIDIKLIYFVFITNFVLLICTKKFFLNPIFFVLLIFLIIHSLICTVVLKMPFTSSLSQIFGIGFSGIYFYNFFKHFALDQMIKKYMFFCFWSMCIGLLFYVFGIFDNQDRLEGVFLEPARLVMMIFPATYYSWKIKDYPKFIFFILCLLLAQSSLGFIAILLSLFIPYINLKRIIQLAIIIPITLIIGALLIQYNKNVAWRYNDTMKTWNILETKKFEAKTNVSTYALLKNYYVTVHSVEENMFGVGLGHFKNVHDRYLPDLKIPPYIKTLKLQNINNLDANSMFLRGVTELGIFFLIIILIMLIYGFKIFSYHHPIAYFAQGIYIIFLIKLFRDGHYFNPENFFYLWCFCFCMQSLKKQRLYENVH